MFPRDLIRHHAGDGRLLDQRPGSGGNLNAGSEPMGWVSVTWPVTSNKSVPECTETEGHVLIPHGLNSKKLKVARKPKPKRERNGVHGGEVRNQHLPSTAFDGDPAAAPLSRLQL